jgi:hypothetical protein
MLIGDFVLKGKYNILDVLVSLGFISYTMLDATCSRIAMSRDPDLKR